MSEPRPRVLWVTDPSYPARGRDYGAEDVRLVERLSSRFLITTCHPRAASSSVTGMDGVVVRNSGPVTGYREAHEALRDLARATGLPVHNPLTGRGDMAGKGYLAALTRQGAPVIPTVDRPKDLHRLPDAEEYVVKPIDGADSHGLRIVARGAVPADLEGMVVQPRVAFVHEVSLVFVDGVFRYALVAPDPARRWELVPFTPSAGDLAFARWFVDWNDMPRGIQRVDACRLADGELLLVELEDLNPYLSLHALDATTREDVVTAIGDSIAAVLAGP